MEIMCKIFWEVVIPIVLAFFTAWLTAKQYANKQVYKNRETLYFELYKQLKNLQKNPCQIYEKEYVAALSKLQAKVDIYASQEVMDVFEQSYSFISNAYQEYKKRTDTLEEDFENKMSSDEYISQEYDGDKQYAKMRMRNCIEHNIEEYRKKHLNTEHLKNCTEALKDQMRKELKTHKIEKY